MCEKDVLDVPSSEDPTQLSAALSQQTRSRAVCSTAASGRHGQGHAGATVPGCDRGRRSAPVSHVCLGNLPRGDFFSRVTTHCTRQLGHRENEMRSCTRPSEVLQPVWHLPSRHCQSQGQPGPVGGGGTHPVTGEAAQTERDAGRGGRQLCRPASEAVGGSC